MCNVPEVNEILRFRHIDVKLSGIGAGCLSPYFLVQENDMKKAFLSSAIAAGAIATGVSPIS
jgi:hypothetical protein